MAVLTLCMCRGCLNDYHPCLLSNATSFGRSPTFTSSCLRTESKERLRRSLRDTFTRIWERGRERRGGRERAGERERGERGMERGGGREGEGGMERVRGRDGEERRRERGGGREGEERGGGERGGREE